MHELREISPGVRHGPIGETAAHNGLLQPHRKVLMSGITLYFFEQRPNRRFLTFQYLGKGTIPVKQDPCNAFSAIRGS